MLVIGEIDYAITTHDDDTVGYEKYVNMGHASVNTMAHCAVTIDDGIGTPKKALLSILVYRYRMSLVIGQWYVTGRLLLVGFITYVNGGGGIGATYDITRRAARHEGIAEWPLPYGLQHIMG